MINKKVISDIVSKYSLGNNIEKVKWIITDEKLIIHFINDSKNLDRKHTQIVEGDKIKWVYLRDNPYKIDTMGFLDFDLPKPIRKFIEEYVDIPRSFDTILKNKLESFYEDLGWGNLTLNTYVQQFFKF